MEFKSVVKYNDEVLSDKEMEQLQDEGWNLLDVHTVEDESPEQVVYVFNKFIH